MARIITTSKSSKKLMQRIKQQLRRADIGLAFIARHNQLMAACHNQYRQMLLYKRAWLCRRETVIRSEKSVRDGVNIPVSFRDQMRKEARHFHRLKERARSEWLLRKKALNDFVSSKNSRFLISACKRGWWLDN